MRTVASIDPLFCLEDRIPSTLVDLAGRLQNEANEFDKELPRSSHIRKQLRDMVRMMNCYYSNLIEGNNTRPANIRAPYQLGLPKEYHKHFFPKLIASE